MASAISVPITSSLEDTVPTRAMSSLPDTALEFAFSAATALSTAFWIPLRMTIGFAPAATFFMPSWMKDCASSVAVVVPSPAASFVLDATSRISCAPMFSDASSSSISFAIVTPSFVISGVPYFLSRTTFLPFGPMVIFTVFASLSTPAISAFLASTPYTIFFAIILICSLFYVWGDERGTVAFENELVRSGTRKTFIKDEMDLACANPPAHQFERSFVLRFPRWIGSVPVLLLVSLVRGICFLVCLSPLRLRGCRSGGQRCIPRRRT